MKRIIFVYFLFFLGCSPFEFSRLLGAGTKVFKEQGKVYSKTFDKDFFSCYKQITRGLKEMNASAYRGSRKQGFLVVNGFNQAFIQCDRATEVAIFFIESDKLKTKVEVVSFNYSLAEFVASKLFGSLEGEEQTQSTEGEIKKGAGFERKVD